MGHNGAAITGCGAALPERRLTNRDLEKMVDTSDRWILERTGIRERRLLEEGLSTVDLSERAARDALDGAGIKPHELELILVATVTPDYPLPAAACCLQARLGAFRAAAMDVAAGCSGFIYGLAVADQFIRSGAYRNVLVVGVEIPSRIVDWSDRSTCVLFGDGAGAVVMQPADGERGLVAFELGADGRGRSISTSRQGDGSSHQRRNGAAATALREDERHRDLQVCRAHRSGNPGTPPGEKPPGLRRSGSPVPAPGQPADH